MTGAPPPLPRRTSSALPAIVALLLIGGVATAGLTAAFLVWQMSLLEGTPPAEQTAAPPAAGPEPVAPAEPPPVEAVPEPAPAPDVLAPTPAKPRRERAAVPATPEGGTVGSRLGGLPGEPPPPPPPQRPLPVQGGIRPPVKIRNVAPVYPETAVRARIQGVVIIEATIDETGKVAQARVLRSIPLLDQAALDAVRQWEYAPTLLNGKPVPVIMTVTVNFSLQ